MNKDNKDARISIVTRKSDGSKWVRVEALGEDFCIAPKDINNRDDMTYDEAMKALEAAGVTTFDKKELVCQPRIMEACRLCRLQCHQLLVLLRQLR